jgi:hypothetical protein
VVSGIGADAITLAAVAARHFEVPVTVVLRELNRAVQLFGRPALQFTALNLPSRGKAFLGCNGDPDQPFGPMWMHFKPSDRALSFLLLAKGRLAPTDAVHFRLHFLRTGGILPGDCRVGVRRGCR